MSWDWQYSLSISKSHFLSSVSVLAFLGDCLDGQVQGGRVGEDPQPGLVEHYGGGGAILVPVTWLGEVNLQMLRLFLNISLK